MNQDIYDIFGQKLKEASQPYPAHLWDTIQPQVPVYGKQSGTKAGWYWFAGSALVLIASAIWLATDRSNQEVRSETSLLPAQAHVASAIYTNPAPIKQVAPLSYDQNTEKEISTLSQKESEPAFTKINEQTSLSDEPTKSTIQTQTSSNESQVNRDDQVKPLQIQTENNIPEPSTSKAKASSLSSSSTTNSIRSVLVAPKLPTHTNQLQKTSGVKFEMAPDPSCYNFSNRHQAKFTADIYTGIGYGLRPMTSINEDVSTYIDARKDTESFRYLFTAGARINMMMNNGLAFRTGVHYTQIGEKFDYTDSSAIRVIWISDTTFVGGDTIVNPPMQQIQPGTAIKKINNRYHSFDIPILIGYDVPLGRMQASVSAGPIINISSWQRGQFLNPSLEPAYINTEEPVQYYPAYKTTLGIGAYISASLAVPITEKIWLFGEPHVLHRFNPVTFDDYPIKQSNTNFGLNVGLKLKL